MARRTDSRRKKPLTTAERGVRSAQVVLAAMVAQIDPESVKSKSRRGKALDGSAGVREN
jgi:hypothetical protein